VTAARGALAFVFVPQFSRSAFRHGQSKRDIQRALDNPIYDEPITTRQGTLDCAWRA